MVVRSLTPFEHSFGGIVRSTRRLMIVGLLVGIAFTVSPEALAETHRVAPSEPGGTLPDWSHVPMRDPAQTLADLEKALHGPRLVPPEPSHPMPEHIDQVSPIVNLNTGVGFSDLQSAVSAASAGDELRVQQDTSEGVVIIDRDLILSGSSPSIVISSSIDTTASGDDRGWIRVLTGVELHVQNLVFDGSGRSIFQAFRHQGSGSFDGVTFRNIQYEPNGPSYAGTAIVAFGERVDIRNCAFESIGRVGVLYFGATVANAIFENNAYVGKGTGDHIDYGLEVGAGATVAAWNNDLRDCGGVATQGGIFSGAVLITTFSGPGSALVARSNTIVDSFHGFAIGTTSPSNDSSATSVSFNRIVGNTKGIQYRSTLAGSSVHNWWGCDAGANQLGCDVADEGASSGANDLDPWLVLTVGALRDPVPNECSTNLRGHLWRDSDGADTSAMGSAPDGTIIQFGADAMGSVMPTSAPTVYGAALTLFQPVMATGPAVVSATLDNQTVQATLTLVDVLFCDGFESGDTTGWTSTVP
jgi:hypothetical protein